MSTIDETIKERDTRHGGFAGVSRISQALKRVMRQGRNWNFLEDDQREALEMIQHKVARILNGDASYIENYRDAEGYAKLISNRLMETDSATDTVTISMKRVAGKWERVDSP